MKIWLSETDLDCLIEGEEVTIENKIDIEVNKAIKNGRIEMRDKIIHTKREKEETIRNEIFKEEDFVKINNNKYRLKLGWKNE